MSADSHPPTGTSLTASGQSSSASETPSNASWPHFTESSVHAFIATLTSRSSAQDDQIKELWEEVKRVHADKLRVEEQKLEVSKKAHADESKSAQLKLEAKLGFGKAVLAAALALVLLFKLGDVAEVLKGLAGREVPLAKTAASPSAASVPSAAPQK